MARDNKAAEGTVEALTRDIRDLTRFRNTTLRIGTREFDDATRKIKNLRSELNDLKKEGGESFTFNLGQSIQQGLGQVDFGGGGGAISGLAGRIPQLAAITGILSGLDLLADKIKEVNKIRLEIGDSARVSGTALRELTARS